MTNANPLLEPWDDTPFGMPPFARIRPEHVAPAFAAAMEQHRDAVRRIGADPAPPGFDNTVVALQRADRLLVRVGSVFSNLVQSLGGAAWEALDREMAPQLARHAAAVALDAAVFARVDALHARRDALDLAEDQRRLLDRTHLGLVRAGAALPAAGQARIAAIAERLAVLHTAFGQNVLHDEKTWHLPLADAELDGLPDFLRANAAAAARDRGLPGHAVTLSRSLLEPFLCFCPRRALREAAWRAWTARGGNPGAHDNRPLIPQILALRAERARLLGCADFAAFRLADSMAGTPEAAEALLRTVWEPARRKADAERERLQREARADGLDAPLAPWDWRFYAERVRRADHALDEAAVKPFFTLPNMQRAAFDTATRLFGVSFAPIADAPAYHPDMQAWEMRDAAGAHLGVFLADPFARPDKRSGAWMSSFRDQETLDGAVSPIIVNNNNVARAEPALLSYDDAETLFHEFGHALHGLLSQVRYPGQSGTIVRRDFVELPSQIFEHWLALPDTLRRYARHHATDAPVPEPLIARLLAARTFNQGFATVEYVASALLDLALHRHPAPETIDIDAFEQDFLRGIGMPDAVVLRHRPAHFQHLFSGGGYAASYYSYLWAEVLDADGFDAFTETGDPFDPATAARLRTVLSAGDTRDPMELYAEFRGRPPTPAALLRHRGLA